MHEKKRKGGLSMTVPSLSGYRSKVQRVVAVSERGIYSAPAVGGLKSACLFGRQALRLGFRRCRSEGTASHGRIGVLKPPPLTPIFGRTVSFRSNSSGCQLRLQIFERIPQREFQIITEVLRTLFAKGWQRGPVSNEVRTA